MKLQIHTGYNFWYVFRDLISFQLNQEYETNNGNEEKEL